MMATTHALAGVLLGSVALLVAPEFAPVAVLAGFVGGVFPDLDLPASHRRTLHFPVYYSGAAAATLVIAAVAPATWSVALGVFLLSAAVHSVSDAFGGGLELKPWRGESERAVYDHFRGRWIRPRRWIRYDGAPEDFVLTLALAVPGVALYDGAVETLVVAAVFVSAVYALLRKPLVTVAERLVEQAPVSVLAYVPDRFIADLTR